jgi:hypothetical protein
MTAAELASALDVKRLLIAEAVYDSTDQGQTASTTAVWGKHFVLYFAPETAVLRQPTLGYYLFQAEGRTVYVNPQDEPPMSDKMQVIDKYEMSILDVNCGYLIASAIA